MTSTSHSVSFIARMLSVVHAIHPADVSSCGGALSPSPLRVCSKAGISWTPIVNNGRSRWAGASAGSKSETAWGILDKTEKSYTA